MPTFDGKDGSKHFSMNPQVGKARFGSKEAQAPKEKGAVPAHEAGDAGTGHTTLHAHGDGTYHTEHSDGTRTEHPHIGHAVTHMAKTHEPHGTHMHIHHSGGSITSHHSKDGEETQGPHDHENIEALKDHMDQFLTEEGNEKGDDYASGGEGEEDGGDEFSV